MKMYLQKFRGGVNQPANPQLPSDQETSHNFEVKANSPKVSTQALAESKVEVKESSKGSQPLDKSEQELNKAIEDRDKAVKDAQYAGVTVTKVKPVYIEGKDGETAKDVEQKAIKDNYPTQVSALNQARDKQNAAKSQTEQEYSDKLDKYKQKLKENKLPNVDATGALTGNDINQKFVIGDESDATIEAKIATDNTKQDLSDLRIVEGNDNDYSKNDRTFTPQGPFHEVQFIDKDGKPGQSHAIKGHFADITFDNLQNSFYNGQRIAKVNMALSDLERDERIDNEHYKNHGVVVYDDIVRGLQYAGSSITVTYTFYDDQGKQITFTSDPDPSSSKNNAWFAPFSLNNHGHYVEGTHILDNSGQHKQLMGSAISIHTADPYPGEYADKGTPGLISDGKNGNKKWDLTVKQDTDGLRTYGAGLYQATGNEIKLQFFMKLNDLGSHQFDHNNKGQKLAWTHGSIWSGIDTSIPSYNIDNTPAPIAKNATVQAYYYDNNLQVPGSVTYIVEPGAEGSGFQNNKKDSKTGEEYAKRDNYTFTNNVVRIGNKTKYEGWVPQQVKLPTDQLKPGYSFYWDKDGKQKIDSTIIDPNNDKKVSGFYLDAYNPKRKIYILGDVQQAQIVYRDVNDKNNIKTLATDDSNTNHSLSGRSGDKIAYSTKDQINKFESQGYILTLNGNGFDPDGKIQNFDDNDEKLQTFYVDFKHGTRPVTKDKPADPRKPVDPTKTNTPLPSNPNLSKNDLDKTVTRTIEYKYTDGKIAHNPVVQKVHFVGKGTIDLVTGNLVTLNTDGSIKDQKGSITWRVTSDNSNKASYAESPVINIPGYHIINVISKNTEANINQQTGIVAEEQVTHNSNNSNIVITLAKDTAKGKVTYIDDTINKILDTDNFDGSVGDKIDYSTINEIKDWKSRGYKLVSDGFTPEKGKPARVYTEGKNSWEVHFVHDTESVTEHAKAQEIIHYVKADDNSKIHDDYTSPEIQYSRTGTKDKVNGQTSNWSGWTKNNGQPSFSDQTSPHIDGYTPDQPSVSAPTVDTDKLTNNGLEKIEKTVIYTANDQNATITYIDDDATNSDNRVVGNGNANGKFDTAIHFDKNPQDEIAKFEKKGYKFVSNNFHDTDKYKSDNNKNKFEVHFVHDHVTINPKDPHSPKPNPNDPINPNDPDHKSPKYPNEVDKLTDTVNQTIHYVYKTGTKGKQGTASPDVTDHKDYTRKIVFDKVNGNKLSDTWSSNQDFSTKNSPIIPGYNPDISSITDKNIAHDADDIEKTVTYSPDKQKADVTYIDDNTGDTLKKDPLEGVSDEKSTYTAQDKITNFKNMGYEFVSNNYPDGGFTFDHDDSKDQSFVIHLKHGTTTVDPKHPQTPKDPINPHDPRPKDDQPKYPDDIDKLTDTVNQTIHYVYKAGTKGKQGTASPDVTDHKDYTRTVVFDKVTGEKKSDVWTPAQSFSTKTSPTIPGYTVDTHSITDNNIAHDHADIDKTVTYTPDKQNADVTYIDDNTGVTLKKDSLEGVTDEHSTYTAQDKINNFENMGYELVSNDYPAVGFIFDNDVKTDQHFVIHLKHGTVPVTPAKPGKPGEPINPNDPRPDHPTDPNDPDNHKSVFPPKTDTEGLQKDVNRTITYKFSNPTGHHTDSLPKTVNDKLHFTAKKLIDKVTGKQVGDDEWSEPQDFKTIQTPSIKGYTPDREEVANTGIGYDHGDIKEEVVYSPDAQHAHVKYIDDTTKSELTHKDLDGHTDETDSYRTTDTINEYVNRGFELVSDNYPTNGVVYDNDDAQDQFFEVHLKHGTVPVTPEKPGKPGEPINPNDPRPKEDQPKYPSDTDAKHLQKDINRTITYKFSNSTDRHTDSLPKTVNDKLHFTAKKVIDKVTGEQVGDDEWSEPQDFKTIQTPSIKGYTPDREEVANTGIDHTHKDITEEVVYTPDAQKAHVKYVDDTTGNELTHKDLDGHTDETDSYRTTDTINEYVNRGFELVSDNYPTNGVVYDNDDAQDQFFEVHLKHGTVPVTPEKPGKPGEPINPNDPDHNGPKYPSDSDATSLQHDVKRTIKYVYEDGSQAHKPAEDVLHFEETKVIDKVTGEIISDKWDGPKDFEDKKSPDIPGYTASRVEVSNKNIGHDHEDIVETVVYTPNPVPPTVPEDQGSTPDPDPHKPTNDPKQPTPDTPNVPDDYKPTEKCDLEVKDDNQKKNEKAAKTEKHSKGGEVDQGISIDHHISKNVSAVKTDGVSTKIKKNVNTLPQTGEKQNVAGLVGLALAAVAGLLIFGGDKRRNK